MRLAARLLLFPPRPSSLPHQPTSAGFVSLRVRPRFFTVVQWLCSFVRRDATDRQTQGWGGPALFGRPQRVVPINSGAHRICTSSPFLSAFRILGAPQSVFMSLSVFARCPSWRIACLARCARGELARRGEAWGRPPCNPGSDAAGWIRQAAANMRGVRSSIQRGRRGWRWSGWLRGGIGVAGRG